MQFTIFLLALLAPAALGRTLPLSKHTRAMFRMDHQPYIIGGEDANVNEWPWQGYMEQFGSFYCGVTIISDEWVMTAAHCIFGASPNFIQVGLGYTDYGDGSQGEMYDVDEVIEHPDFAFVPANGDDVGVMHLTTTLDLPQDNLQAITLSSVPGFDFAGNSECYITGWGQDANGILPERLQEANIGVYTLEECEDVWGASEIEDNEHVCVGTPGEQGSCSGDSGGPAVCLTDADEWVQIGITSWGVIGCSPDFPSVYTNVAQFRDWVIEECGGCIE